MRCLLVLAACLAAAGCGFQPDDPALQTDRPVGRSARDLLSDSRFKSMIVEIQAVQGWEPTQEAMSALLDFLERRLNKPDGIRLVMDPPLRPNGQQIYSASDARDIEDSYRRNFPGDPTIVAFLLFLDGTSTQDHPNLHTLGLSYRNTSIALFEKTLRDLSGGEEQPMLQVLEATVLEHEFGHLLGLVDSGTPMRSMHADADHPGHCTNPHCLMYFATHSSPMESLLGGAIPELDDQCLRDLRANGGK